MSGASPPIVLAVTGASGQIYALQALKHLLQSEYIVELILSKGAYRVWWEEMGVKIPAVATQAEFWRQQVGVASGGKLICHHWNDVGAGIASGSYRTRGMVVGFNILTRNFSHSFAIFATIVAPKP